jgi:hypothetical protein
MTSIQIRRHELRFLPDCSHVLIRPFIPADRSRLTQIIGRALALSEEDKVESISRTIIHEGAHKWAGMPGTETVRYE